MSKNKSNKGNSTIDGVLKAVEKTVTDANIKLVEITKGGFPYDIEDVVLTIECDSAGIYLHSGSTPVAAIVRAGSPEAVASELKTAVREIVESTKAAVERRGSLRDEEKDLKETGVQIEKAAAALKAAGLEASQFISDIDADARQAIVAAAKKAVQEANKNPFIDIVDYKSWRLSVQDFPRGVVITAGDAPVMITRFPKVCSNKTIEKMVSWIQNDVAALSASRNRYFERVRLEAAREEKLRSLSAQLDDTQARIAAM